MNLCSAMQVRFDKELDGYRRYVNKYAHYCVQQLCLHENLCLMCPYSGYICACVWVTLIFRRAQLLLIISVAVVGSILYCRCL